LLACPAGSGLVRAIGPLSQNRLHLALRILIGSVWVFHGLYSKLLDGVPRHRLIVARVLGDDLATVATRAVGVGEILLGLWAFSHRWPRACATAQTLAIATMNTLEISRAPDLLISAPGMVALNLAFLALGWYSATRKPLH
jgi:uncharacterized membrane protein YphA (DoxX/SURF4 family)